jgi:hypothetical protein
MLYQRLKIAIVVAIVIMIILQSTGSIQANPYIYDYKVERTVGAPVGTKPPVITVLSPENQSINSPNNLYLNFSVSIEKPNNLSLSVTKISYKGSWQSTKTEIERASEYAVNLTNIPIGPRWIEITAIATGVLDSRTVIDGFHKTVYYVYCTTSSSSIVHFTVGDIPKILSISVENNTFNSATVPFDITFDGPIKKAYYDLDNQGNVTFCGNTTLAGLGNGHHNITIYSIGEDGIVSYPKIVYFDVEASLPFSIIIIITSFLITTAIFVSLLFYRRYRKTANLK